MGRKKGNIFIHLLVIFYFGLAIGWCLKFISQHYLSFKSQTPSIVGRWITHGISDSEF